MWSLNERIHLKQLEQYLRYSVYSLNISNYVSLYRQTKTEMVTEHNLEGKN